MVSSVSPAQPIVSVLYPVKEATSRSSVTPAVESSKRPLSSDPMEIWVPIHVTVPPAKGSMVPSGSIPNKVPVIFGPPSCAMAGATTACIDIIRNAKTAFVKNFIIIIQVLLTEQTGLAGHKKYQSSCSVSLGGCLGCFRTSSGKLSLGEMKRLGEGCCTAEVYNMVILPNVSFPL